MGEEQYQEIRSGQISQANFHKIIIDKFPINFQLWFYRYVNMLSYQSYI